MIIFKHKQTIITKHMIFRVSGQKTNTTTSAKCTGVYINNSLIWETHFKNPILNSIEQQDFSQPKFTLKMINCSLFNSHLIYSSQIWGQIKTKLFQEVGKLQNKAIPIIDLLSFNSSNINKTCNYLQIIQTATFYIVTKQLICERLL